MNLIPNLAAAVVYAYRASDPHRSRTHWALRTLIWPLRRFVRISGADGTRRIRKRERAEPTQVTETFCDGLRASAESVGVQRACDTVSSTDRGLVLALSTRGA